MQESKEVRKSGPTDHLANERTFLAWIRTSIALIGFGFVIVKFALFVHQISLAMGGTQVPPAKGRSAIIGVVMIAFGAVIALLSYMRYRGIEKQLNNNEYSPSPLLSMVVTVTIIIASLLLVIYLLPSI